MRKVPSEMCTKVNISGYNLFDIISRGSFLTKMQFSFLNTVGLWWSSGSNFTFMGRSMTLCSVSNWLESRALDGLWASGLTLLCSDLHDFSRLLFSDQTQMDSIMSGCTLWKLYYHWSPMDLRQKMTKWRTE